MIYGYDIPPIEWQQRKDFYPSNTFRPSGQYNIIEPEEDKEDQEICLNCGEHKGNHIYKDHRYYC